MDRDLRVNISLEGDRKLETQLSGLLDNVIKKANDAGKDISRGITPDVRGFDRSIKELNAKVAALQEKMGSTPKAMTKGTEEILLKYKLLEDQIGKIAAQNEEMYASFKGAGNLKSFAKAFESLNPKKVAELTDAFLQMTSVSKGANDNIEAILGTISQFASQGKDAAGTIKSVGDAAQTASKQQEKTFRGMTEEARKALEYYRELENASKNIGVGSNEAKIRAEIAKREQAYKSLEKAIASAKSKNEDFVKVQKLDGVGISFDGSLEDAIQEHARYAAEIVSIYSNGGRDASKAFKDSLYGVVNEAETILNKRMAETFSKYYSGSAIGRLEVKAVLEKDPNLLEPLNKIIDDLQKSGKIHSVQIPVELVEVVGEINAEKEAEAKSKKGKKKKEDKVALPKDADDVTKDITATGNPTLKQIDEIRKSVLAVEDDLLSKTTEWKKAMNEQLQIKLDWNKDGNVAGFDTLLGALTNASETDPVLLQLDTDAIVQQIREALNNEKFSIALDSDKLAVVANLIGTTGGGSLGIDPNSLAELISRVQPTVSTPKEIVVEENGEESPVEEVIEEALSEVADSQEKQSKITEEAGKYLESIYKELEKYVSIQNRDIKINEGKKSRAEARLKNLEKDPVKNAEAIARERSGIEYNEKQIGYAKRRLENLTSILSLDDNVLNMVNDINDISDPEEKIDKIREFILGIVKSSTLVDKFSSKKTVSLLDQVKRLVDAEEEYATLKESPETTPEYLAQKEKEVTHATEAASSNVKISKYLLDLIKKIYVAQTKVDVFRAETDDAANREIEAREKIADVGQLARMGKSASEVSEAVKNGNIPAQEKINAVFDEFSKRAQLTPQKIENIRTIIGAWLTNIRDLEKDIAELEKNPITNKDAIDAKKDKLQKEMAALSSGRLIKDVVEKRRESVLAQMNEELEALKVDPSKNRALKDRQEFSKSFEGYRARVQEFEDALKEATQIKSLLDSLNEQKKKTGISPSELEDTERKFEKAKERLRAAKDNKNEAKFFKDEVDKAFQMLSESAKKYIPQLLDGAANKTGLSREEMLGGTSEEDLRKYYDARTNLTLFQEQDKLVQDVIDAQRRKISAYTQATKKSNYGDYDVMAVASEDYASAIQALNEFLKANDGYQEYIKLATEELLDAQKKSAELSGKKGVKKEELDAAESRLIEARNRVNNINNLNAREYFEQEVDVAYSQLSESAKQYIPQLLENAVNESGLSREEMLGGTSEEALRKYSEAKTSLDTYKMGMQLVADASKVYESAQQRMVGNIVGELKKYSLRADYVDEKGKKQSGFINARDLTGKNRTANLFSPIIKVCEGILKGTDLILREVSDPNTKSTGKGDRAMYRRDSGIQTSTITGIQDVRARDKNYSPFSLSAEAKAALGETVTWEDIITQNKEKQLELERQITELQGKESGYNTAIQAQRDLLGSLKEVADIPPVIDTSALKQSKKDLEAIQAVLTLIRKNSSDKGYAEVASYIDSQLKVWSKNKQDAPSEDARNFIASLKPSLQGAGFQSSKKDVIDLIVSYYKSADEGIKSELTKIFGKDFLSEDVIKNSKEYKKAEADAIAQQRESIRAKLQTDRAQQIKDNSRVSYSGIGLIETKSKTFADAQNLVKELNALESDGKKNTVEYISKYEKLVAVLRELQKAQYQIDRGYIVNKNKIGDLKSANEGLNGEIRTRSDEIIRLQQQNQDHSNDSKISALRAEIEAKREVITANERQIASLQRENEEIREMSRNAKFYDQNFANTLGNMSKGSDVDLGKEYLSLFKSGTLKTTWTKDSLVSNEEVEKEMQASLDEFKATLAKRLQPLITDAMWDNILSKLQSEGTRNVLSQIGGGKEGVIKNLLDSLLSIYDISNKITGKKSSREEVEAWQKKAAKIGVDETEVSSLTGKLSSAYLDAMNVANSSYNNLGKMFSKKSTLSNSLDELYRSLDVVESIRTEAQNLIKLIPDVDLGNIKYLAMSDDDLQRARKSAEKENNDQALQAIREEIALREKLRLHKLSDADLTIEKNNAEAAGEKSKIALIKQELAIRKKISEKGIVATKETRISAQSEIDRLTAQRNALRVELSNLENELAISRSAGERYASKQQAGESVSSLTTGKTTEESAKSRLEEAIRWIENIEENIALANEKIAEADAIIKENKNKKKGLEKYKEGSYWTKRANSKRLSQARKAYELSDEFKTFKATKESEMNAAILSRQEEAKAKNAGMSEVELKALFDTIKAEETQKFQQEIKRVLDESAKRAVTVSYQEQVEAADRIIANEQTLIDEAKAKIALLEQQLEKAILLSGVSEEELRTQVQIRREAAKGIDRTKIPLYEEGSGSGASTSGGESVPSGGAGGGVSGTHSSGYAGIPAGGLKQSEYDLATESTLRKIYTELSGEDLGPVTSGSHYVSVGGQQPGQITGYVAPHQAGIDKKPDKDVVLGIAKEYFKNFDFSDFSTSVKKLKEKIDSGTLSTEQYVAAQKALKDAFWNHRKEDQNSDYNLGLGGGKDTPYAWNAYLKSNGIFDAWSLVEKFRVNEHVQSGHKTSSAAESASVEQQVAEKINGLLKVGNRFIGREYENTDKTSETIRGIVGELSALDPSAFDQFVNKAKAFQEETAPLTEQLSRITSAASVSTDELANFPETFKLLNTALDAEYGKESQDLEKILSLKIKIRNLNSQNAKALAEAGIGGVTKNANGTYNKKSYDKYLEDQKLSFSQHYNKFGNTSSTKFILDELAKGGIGSGADDYFNKSNYIKVLNFIADNLADLLVSAVKEATEEARAEEASPDVSSAKRSNKQDNEKSFISTINKMLASTGSDSNERMGFFGKEFVLKDGVISGDKGSISGEQIDEKINGLVSKTIVSAFHTHADNLESTLSGSDIDRSIYDAFQNKTNQILKEGSLTKTTATYIDWTGIDESVAEKIKNRIKENLAGLVSDGTPISMGENGWAELAPEFDKLEESAKKELIARWNDAIRKAFESEGHADAFKQMDIEKNGGLEKLRQALAANVPKTESKPKPNDGPKPAEASGGASVNDDEVPEDAASAEELEELRRSVSEFGEKVEQLGRLIDAVEDPEQKAALVEMKKELEEGYEAQKSRLAQMEAADEKPSVETPKQQETLTGGLRNIVAKDSTLQSILGILRSGVPVTGSGSQLSPDEKNAKQVKTYRAKLNAYASKFNKENFAGYDKVTSGPGSGFTNGAKQLTYTLEKAGETAKKVTLIFDEYNGEIQSWVTSTKEYEDTSKKAFKTVGKDYQKVADIYSSDPAAAKSDAFANYKNKIDELNGLLYSEDKDGLVGITSDEKNKKVSTLANEVDRLGAELIEAYKASEKLRRDGSVIQSNFVSNPEDIDAIKTKMMDAARSISGASVSENGFNESTKKLSFTVRDAKGNVTEMTYAYDQFTNSLIRSDGQTKKVQSFWGSVFGGLKNQLASLVRYYSGSMIIQRVINEVRQGITYIKEIDTALTELKKVTDETDATYEKFLKTMSKTAGVVGSTVKELTMSAADWARLGYSIEEAGLLAQNTAILMNVSEFDDVNTATEALISSLQAFGYEASNSIEIVDKLNIVGNNFAISSDGIAEGLKRSASTLVAAGNSLEQSIALLAAGNRVVQDPEALGNALKVVSMRIRGTKTELEEAGEETDGMITNTAKLQEKIMALTNVDGKGGVNILDDSGAFRSTYDIMLDIAEVWDQLNEYDPKAQAALLEVLAGKTRGSQVAGILQNAEDLRDAYETALDSSGSAIRENEKYLDSIQGRIDKLSNSVQTFWLNLIDSDVIKFLVTAGQEIVDFANEFGTLKTVILAFLGIKFVPWFMQTITAASTFKEAFHYIFLSSFSDAKGIIDAGFSKNIIPSFTKNLEKLKGLGLKGILNAIPVGVYLAIAAAIVVGIAALVDKAITTNKEWKESFKDLSEEIGQIQSNIKDLNSELKTTQDRIEELEGKSSLSFTEEEELRRLKLSNNELERKLNLEKEREKRKAKEASKQLQGTLETDGDLSGRSVKYYNKETGDIVSEDEAYNKAGDFVKEGYEAKLTNNLDAKIQQFKEAQSLEEKLAKDLDKAIDDKQKAKTDEEKDAVSKKIEDIEKQYEEASKIREKLETELGDTSDNWTDILSQEGAEWQAAEDGGKLEEWQVNLNKAIQTYEEGVDRINVALGGADAKKLSLDRIFGDNAFDSVDSTRDQINGLVESGTATEEAIVNITNACPDLIEQLEFIGITAEDVAHYFLHIGEMQDEVKPMDAKTILGNLADELDKITTRYDALRGAVEEYNEHGAISAETLAALVDNDLLQYLTVSNGQIIADTEALVKLEEAAIAQANASLKEAMMQDMVNYALGKTAEISSMATSELQEAGIIANASGENAKKGAAGWIEYGAAKMAALSEAPEADAAKVEAGLKTIYDAYTKYANLAGTLSMKKTYSGGSSSSSDKEFDFIDIYFTNLENEISKRQAQLETLLDDTSDLDLKNKLSDEIADYYRQQAASAEKVADYYSNEAAKTLSKIPAKYRDAIQNGTLDVATISDDSLNDMLTKYRDYVDKAADYTEQYWNSLEEIANKAKENFDDIQSDYENKISFNDLFTNQIQNEIDKAEEAGETVSKAYYEALIANNETELELLKKEQAELLEILQSGDVRKGTDQYYEMVAALDDIDSAIDECEKETIGWVNAMHEIDTEQFDKLLDKINRLNDEIQNMYDLFENEDNLVDDTGNWTEDGVTALALLVQQMDNAKYAADEVGKEIASLKPEDFSSTELYEERLNELKDTQWDYIQQAEDAKQSIVDLNETRIDAVRDGMTKELEAYQELTEAKKEALDADRDLYEFEKTMAEHSKNIADIERKLAALNNDHSMEAEAKKRRLQAELAEARAEQEEALRDKNYDDISKAYDDENEAAEESHRLMEEKLELYLEDTERIINESLMNVLANADIVLENLNNTADAHGVTLSEELKAPWMTASQEAEHFKTVAEGQLGALVGEDGVLTVFSVESEDYLTSPFISGEQASAKFKDTVAGHLNGIKEDLDSVYQKALESNKGIIDECNKAIDAYKNVREEASKPVQTISTSSGNLNSGGSGGSGGGGGGDSSVSNPDVKNLQKFLNAYWQENLDVDGKYGPATTAAVKRMQKKLNMTQNGKYQAADVRALNAYYTNLIEQTRKNNVGNGSSMIGQGIAEYNKRKNAIPAAVYAKGTMGTKKDEWAYTDEPWLGDELVLIPGPNGNLQYMRKGTSVIPADITEKLMNLALDPTTTLDRSRPVISAPHIENNSFSIDASIGEVIHIENCTQDTIPDVKKIVNDALEKHTQRLNQSLKRFTR